MYFSLLSSLLLIFIFVFHVGGFVECLMIVDLLFMFKRSTLRTAGSVCMVGTVDVRVIIRTWLSHPGTPKGSVCSCLPRPSLLPEFFLNMSNRGRGMSSPHTFIGSSSKTPLFSKAPHLCLWLDLISKMQRTSSVPLFPELQRVNLLPPTRAGEAWDLTAWTGAYSCSSCSALFLLQPQELSASDTWFQGTGSLIATLTPYSATSH